MSKYIYASQVTDLSSWVCRLTILPWTIREPCGKVVQSLLFFGVRLVWVEIIFTGTALAETFLAGIDGSFELQVKLDRISWIFLFLRCRSEIEYGLKDLPVVRQRIAHSFSE